VKRRATARQLPAAAELWILLSLAYLIIPGVRRVSSCPRQPLVTAGLVRHGDGGRVGPRPAGAELTASTAVTDADFCLHADRVAKRRDRPAAPLLLSVHGEPKRQPGRDA